MSRYDALLSQLSYVHDTNIHQHPFITNEFVELRIGHEDASEGNLVGQLHALGGVFDDGVAVIVVRRSQE